MQLLDEEKMIASMDNDKVELSTKRLQLIDGANYKIINLNQISYIETEEKYKFLFLIISVVGFLSSAVISNSTGNQDASVPGVFIGLISILVFFIYPSKNIVVRSSGGTIRHSIKWLKKSDVDRFVFLVQQQMNKANKS